jgi:succinyl-diaminopimelate desuccinylase
MCDFIQDLRTDYRLPAHPVLGPCTLAVLDIVSGPGRLGPITPDRCEIALDRRNLPEESAIGVQGELEALIAARRRPHPEFRAEVALVKDFPPFYCPPEASVVQLAQNARRAAQGAPGRLGVWRFGVDGTFIHRAGIPCVGFGPGDERWAHTPDEHIPLADLEAACRC